MGYLRNLIMPLHTNTFPDQSSSFRTAILVSVGILVAVASGIAQSYSPFLGPGMVVGLVAVPMLLTGPRQLLIIGILGLLLFSRLLTLVGAPAVVSYASYGAIFLLALTVIADRITMEKSGDNPVSTRMYGLLLLFAGLLAASASVNGWHGVRPLLLWLLLAAPFLTFAAVLELSEVAQGHVRTALITFLALEVAVVIGQVGIVGMGDNVVGTLVGQGAGAHVIGAVCLVGAMFLVAYSRIGRLFPIWPLLGVSLGAVGVLSDAKQVYAAAVVSFGIALLPLLRRRFFQGLAVVSISVAFGLIAIRVYPVFQRIFDVDKVTELLKEKLSYLETVGLRLDPLKVLIGDGPGAGTSRISLLSVEGYGNAPTTIVGSYRSEVATALLNQFRGLATVHSSSSSSPFSSLLSLFTDTGVLGVLLFFLMALQIWRTLDVSDDIVRFTARGLLLTALSLGVVFTWLEEPAFTVFLAVALALLAGRNEISDSQQATSQLDYQRENGGSHANSASP